MPSGRTRQFDVDETLERAPEVFWARGHDGTTLLHGLAVQAASGATEKELRQVSAMALRVWPA